MCMYLDLFSDALRLVTVVWVYDGLSDNRKGIYHSEHIYVAVPGRNRRLFPM